jgi:hypothetical protein
MHYKTHDLGPLFAHKINLQKKSPLVHRFPSHEIEEPYRKSNSLILRLPGTHRGLVLGWWRSTTRTEEQTLLEALQGRQMTDEEFHETEASNA